MATLGTRIDDLGAGVGDQPERVVGADSLDRVDGSANELGGALESSDTAVCDGVTEGAREGVGGLFQGGETIFVDNDGNPYDMDTDEGWDAFLKDYIAAGEESLARREAWATARIPELLEYWEWLGTEEGQVA